MLDHTIGRMTEGQAEALLRQRLSGRVRGLRVHVRGGYVILRGQGLTPYARQTAAYCAREALRLPVGANAIDTRPAFLGRSPDGVAGD